MQKQGLKILTALLFAGFFFPATVSGQFNTSLLDRADSLFGQKRYTQSFEFYTTLFNQKQYTPAMLLKMAYIQEGLDRIAQSAYYLNLYYLATQDETALVKLEELADKYNLDGYKPSELDKAYAIYNRYKDLITMSLGAVLVFLVTLMAVQRLRFHSKPYAAWGIFLVISAALLVHLNFSDRHSKAIIANNNTYLMSGPSAGASVVSIVRDGHRVEVLGRKDVWVRVAWGESEVYIKENNLVPVKL